MKGQDGFIATRAQATAELLAAGFSFPTSIALDDRGGIFVAESGLPFGGAPAGGRVLRLTETGEKEIVAEGFAPPVNGLVFDRGVFYVSEGGASLISRIDLDGRREAVIGGLPGPGNYHTNSVAIGPDGLLYFAQGAMTNSAIVGLDSYELGWLRRLPHAHDVPGFDVVLTGVNVETDDPLSESPRARTGAFVPFGTSTPPGQRIRGETPCTATVMRCDADGAGLEVVAWGLRNAYGLSFLPDGRLLAIDQGADDRGSRPVANAPDLLYEVRSGAWYGWPDFIGGEPVTDARYVPTQGPAPSFLLANHDELPPPEVALVRFPPHSAAAKFTAAPPNADAVAGQIFVALFGDERPMTAPEGPRVGRGVARIDPSDWSLHPVAAGDPFLRPIDVAFEPQAKALYVLDFGYFEMDSGVVARPGTGRLWRLGIESVVSASG